MDVVAILERSPSLTSRDLAFTTDEEIASDFRYPSTTVSGCRPLESSRVASSRSAPQISIVAVTPSPLISSCVLPIETIILAAGCLTRSSATILAPSFVTAMLPSVLYSILSRPRGPKVGRRISENTLAAAIIFSCTSVPLVILVWSLTMRTGAAGPDSVTIPAGIPASITLRGANDGLPGLFFACLCGFRPGRRLATLALNGSSTRSYLGYHRVLN